MRRLGLLQNRLVRAALGVLGTAAVLGAAGAGLWLSGLPQAYYAETRQSVSMSVTDYSAMAGVRLRQVAVAGRKRTPAVDVLDALDLPQGAPLLGFSPEEARERLESLPTVKSATVERRLPDQVFVTLIERTPIAIWQNGDDNLLIDAQGMVLGEISAEHLTLPLVSGKGAPEAASDLLLMFSTEPALAARVKAAIRVGSRRWDLWLDGYAGSGLQVKLPEVGMESAFSRLATLEKTQSLLERDLAMIDMRVPDRLIVRTSRDPDEETGQKGKGNFKLPAQNGPTVKAPATKTAPLPMSGGRDA